MKLKDFNTVEVNWHVEIYNVQGKTWQECDSIYREDTMSHIKRLPDEILEKDVTYITYNMDNKAIVIEVD